MSPEHNPNTRDRGPLRIALYSHDTQGLGHIRRNANVANALHAAHPSARILLLSGVREGLALGLPPGTDSVTLPSLHKAGDGSYRPRALDVPLDDLIGLRERTITAAVRGFAPDVLIVDKVARGMFGELEPALEHLATHPDRRIVLGLRDILDDPITTRREWHAAATTEAVVDSYDAVWVYGDPCVFDTAAEYDLPEEVRRKLHHTGYLAPPPTRRPEPPPGVSGPYDLCLVGGGQDGDHLAETFLAADHPPGVAAVVVAGPYMPEAARRRLDALAAGRGDRRVLGFVPHTGGLLAGARSVVAMGGYNTMNELLVHARPTLVVPRVRPRTEQLIRADRLAGLGLLDVCHPDRLSPRRLGAWLRQADRGDGATGPDRAAASARVDLDGLRRLPRLLDALLAEDHHEREIARAR